MSKHETAIWLKINEKSRGIAKQEESWQKRYIKYCAEDSAFKYWTFKKLYNYIGDVNIKAMLKVVPQHLVYDSSKKYTSFRYDILPLYLLHLKIAFCFYESYHAIFNKGKTKTPNIIDKKTGKTRNVKHVDKLTYLFEQDINDHNDWSEKHNPFLIIQNVRNDIAHNRITRYGYKTADIIHAYLEIFTYLKMKAKIAKFTQDITNICEQQKHAIDKKTGAKLKWDCAKKRYYYWDKAENDDSNKIKNYLDQEKIEKRRHIKHFCKRLKKELQKAMDKFAIKHPYPKQKDKRSRKNVAKDK